MSTQTTNYGLVKPEAQDFIDIGVINSNMDKIDNALMGAVGYAGTLDGSGNLNDFKTANAFLKIASAVSVQKMPPYKNANTDNNNSVVYNFGQDSTAFIQMFFNPLLGIVWYRRFLGWDNPQWGEWTQIATIADVTAVVATATLE